MLALDNNNELYRSHVELKRKMVELCIQAVLADMKDSSANPSGIASIANIASIASITNTANI